VRGPGRHRGIGRHLLRGARTALSVAGPSGRGDDAAPGGAGRRGRPGHLERLLGLKDQAQYGFDDVTGPKLVAAIRHARALVELAEQTLAR
jgi:hypothetical protein